MRKAWATILPVLVLLSGCSAFFETNVLKGLTTVSAPTAADYQGPGGLDKLAKDLGSPAIVAALKSDPAATASIASYLQTTYLSSPPLTTHDQQQAAVLYSELCLKTTSGDQLVNNAVTIALGGVGTKTLLEIMQEIVPPAVATDSGCFCRHGRGAPGRERQVRAVRRHCPSRSFRGEHGRRCATGDSCLDGTRRREYAGDLSRS